MSHISKCKEVFNDKESIQKAAVALGLTFTECTEFRYYQNQLEPCAFKLSVPGNAEAYECGFESNPDGTFTLKYDSFMGGYGLMEVLGEQDAGRFKAEYKYERTKKVARNRGVRFREDRVRGKDGRMKRRLLATVRR